MPTTAWSILVLGVARIEIAAANLVDRRGRRVPERRQERGGEGRTGRSAARSSDGRCVDAPFVESAGAGGVHGGSGGALPAPRPRRDGVLAVPRNGRPAAGFRIAVPVTARSCTANPQRIFHRLEVAAAYLKCVLASIGATKNLCDRGGHSSLDRRGGEGDSLQTSRRSRNEHPQRSPHS